MTEESGFISPLLKHVQAGSRAHLFSLSLGTGALSSKVKQPGREAYQLPTSNAEMDYTSTPPRNLCPWRGSYLSTVTTLTFYVIVGTIFNLSADVSSGTVTRRAMSPQQVSVKVSEIIKDL
jgi:hypothetical protein